MKWIKVQKKIKGSKNNQLEVVGQTHIYVPLAHILGIKIIEYAHEPTVKVALSYMHSGKEFPEYSEIKGLEPKVKEDLEAFIAGGDQDKPTARLDDKKKGNIFDLTLYRKAE